MVTKQRRRGVLAGALVVAFALLALGILTANGPLIVAGLVVGGLSGLAER